jgi:hypothetical protein
MEPLHACVHKEIASNYCGMIIAIGMHKLKFHLEHIFGNVIGCPRVPTDLNIKWKQLFKPFNKRLVIDMGMNASDNLEQG